MAGKLFGDDNIFAQCTCFKHEGGFCVSFQGTPLFCHFLGRVFLYRAKLNAAQARLTQKGDQQKIKLQKSLTALTMKPKPTSTKP